MTDHTLNYTNVYTNETDSSQQGHGLLESTLIGIFLTAVIIVSVVGNVLVCVAILTDKKLRKTSNLFFISLAISDLVVSLLVMPFALANDILQYWPFHIEYCEIWMSFDVLSATASILNLCAISLDRYIHMRNPFRYELWMTNKKCVGFIGLIWLASIIISFPPILLELHKYTPQKAVTTTTTIATIPNLKPPCNLDLSFPYAIISSSISFYIPCIVMVAIYVKMYRLARYHARKIKETQALSILNGRNKHKPAENKALFTLGMIMGLFLLSWIPFFIINLVDSACVESCVPKLVFSLATWLGYLNSTMNPIIYSVFNTDFRAAFKQILLCKRCRRNSDPYDYTPRSRTSSNIGMKKINRTSKSELNGIVKVNLRAENANSNNNNNNVEERLCESQLLLQNGSRANHNRREDSGETTNSE